MYANLSVLCRCHLHRNPEIHTHRYRPTLRNRVSEISEIVQKKKQDILPIGNGLRGSEKGIKLDIRASGNWTKKERDIERKVLLCYLKKD